MTKFRYIIVILEDGIMYGTDDLEEALLNISDVSLVIDCELGEELLSREERTVIQKCS